MNVKISDFGFAVQLDESERLSDLCGTPGYLAPETLACSMYENLPGYGMEVDMWACGVILFTLYVVLIKKTKKSFLLFSFIFLGYQVLHLFGTEDK
jgi:serine/threonine protein kinase